MSNTRAKSTRAAGIVGIAVMGSRILGLIREMLFNSLLGGGRNLDMFIVAFRIPNLLRDLFAEGALSTAFITVFSKKVKTEGDESAWKLANKMATLLTVFMSAIVLIGVLISPWIVQWLTPGFDAEKIQHTVLLTRIMFPFILLVSLAALVMGILNAKDVFGIPATASSFFNLGAIIGGVALGWWIDPTWGMRSLIGVSLGTLIGGILQLIIQFPALRKVKYRFRPDFHWQTPGVRKVLSLMGPAIIAASAVQVNVLVNTAFASELVDGSISWLNAAFRLMQLPLGLFGVAIATVTLPMVSKSAAVGDMSEFRSTLASGMRLALFFTIPSSLGLTMLAYPIISLLYGRGKFIPEHVMQTGGALQYYAIGLIFYSVLKVIVPAFYAIDRKNTPMMVGFLSIAVNAGLNGFFILGLGLDHRALAFSTSMVAMINFIILYELMRKHIGGLETRALLVSVLKCGLAGIALVGVAWIGRVTLMQNWEQLMLWLRIFYLGITIVAAGGAFFTVGYFLRIEELRDALSMFTRRLQRADE